MPFEITILGSNSSLPAYGRHHTAQFIHIGNHYFLVDCGEGTQYQVQRYQIKSSRINNIFISHLHGDHCLGLMGMIYSFHLTGRTKELTIYGQRGLEEIITTHLRHSKSLLNYPLNFVALDPEKKTKIFSSQALDVWSFPLKHRIPCCGFLFKEKNKPRRIREKDIPDNFPHHYFESLKKGEDIFDGEGVLLYKNSDLTYPPHKCRSYAFCSDTGFYPELSKVLDYTDMVYHETTFLDSKEEWARQTFHSTTIDAATIAKNSKIGKLLIGHFSARYKKLDDFVAECRKVFPESYAAVEGETYKIKQ